MKTDSEKDDQNDSVVTMDRLTFSKCRYIVSDINGINTLYCGKEISIPPYCEHHYSICYVKPKFTKDRNK